MHWRKKVNRKGMINTMGEVLPTCTGAEKKFPLAVPGSITEHLALQPDLS